MRVSRQTYPEDFMEGAVALVRSSDRSYKQIAEDLGINPCTLRGWYNKAEMAKKLKAKPKVRVVTEPAGESAEQKLARLERENERLRKENDRLQMDREILKKAAAFFAKESE